MWGKELDEEYRRELQSSIRKQLELMDIKVNDNKISKEVMIRVMKRIYSGDYTKINGNNRKGNDNNKDDKETVGGLIDLFRDVPEMVNIDEIWKYINPIKMENIFNEMLSEIDLSKILGDIGNTKPKDKVNNDL